MGEFDQVNPSMRKDWEPNFEIELPPLPRTVTEVSKLLAEETDPPDTPRLVEIVKADPVIGTSVLRRINSAYYGMRTRVVEIDKATQLLGCEEVCDIVRTAGVMKLGDIFETETQIEIFDRIMELSLGAATYTKMIADKYDIPQKSIGFTTGLLHTVGRLILLYNRPNDYEALWFTTEKGRPPTVTSEQIIFGTDHAELSALAGEEWRLPENAVTVMRFYLTPGHINLQPSRVLALCLAVASAATDHYCLNETERTGTEFAPPAAMYALARQLDVKPNVLSEYITSQRDDVLRFIRSMVDPKTD
ncbi:MAG: HDOD domain-containing protein [Rhodothermales bacterium]